MYLGRWGFDQAPHLVLPNVYHLEVRRRTRTLNNSLVPLPPPGRLVWLPPQFLSALAGCPSITNCHIFLPLSLSSRVSRHLFSLQACQDLEIRTKWIHRFIGLYRHLELESVSFGVINKSKDISDIFFCRMELLSGNDL